MGLRKEKSWVITLAALEAAARDAKPLTTTQPTSEAPTELDETYSPSGKLRWMMFDYNKLTAEDPGCQNQIGDQFRQLLQLSL
jgi:hypothetical protein